MNRPSDCPARPGPEEPWDERLLDHLVRCPACRREVASEEPTRVFRLLARRPLPANLLEELSSGVAAALDEREGDIRAPVVPRVRPRTVAWAAAALLAVGLGFLVARSPVPVAGPEGGATLAELPAPRPRASVAVLSPQRDARVVDLTVGETQVVMIFDGGLDL